MTQDYRLIISKFLEWLSGFTDADGFFNLQRRYVRSTHGKKADYLTYEPRFGINLRDDDKPILQTIRDTLGFGHINPNTKLRNLVNTEEKEYQTKPQACYVVTSVKDCLKIGDIFTEHPLRSRKQAIFEVWAKAVKECARGKYKNLRLLELYRMEMQELRKYQGSESILSEVEHFLQENKQMELFEKEEEHGAL